MVEPNSAVTAISSIAATVKDMKDILDIFPIGIVLPPNKYKAFTTHQKLFFTFIGSTDCQGFVGQGL